MSLDSNRSAPNESLRAAKRLYEGLDEKKKKEFANWLDSLVKQSKSSNSQEMG